MKVKNIQTNVEYTMPRKSWDELGKNQRLFKVIDDNDTPDEPLQTIDNTLKPTTGEKNKKDTPNNTSKKK